MTIDLVPVGAAFLTGLAGSAHCVVMCGGIATALGAASHGPGDRVAWSAAATLNVARVTGCVVAGLFAGAIGAGIGALLDAAELRWLLRSALGLALIAVGLRLFGAAWANSLLGRLGARAWQATHSLRACLLPATTPMRRWAAGMLWGWLPCGLSTSVLLAAWLTGSILTAPLMMAAFGAGTLPMMIPLTWAGTRARSLSHPRGLGVLVALGGVTVLVAPWVPWHPTLARGLRLLGCLPPG